MNGITKHNPWPGLSSYKDPIALDQVMHFCGREKEIKELSGLIEKNILVTLYSKSGLGKTSLINAGISPQLRNNHFFPINIRLGLIPREETLQDAIISIVENTLEKQDCRNDVQYDVIDEFELITPSKDSPDYLWTYFVSHVFEDAASSEVVLLLAFDQFEELLYSRPSDTAILLKQILYLMDDNNRLPTFKKGEISYNYKDRVHFLLSIREDNLFMLEDVIDNNYLQSMKNNRYRLRELTAQNALQIVKVPGKEWIAESELENVAKRIVDESKDEDGAISSLMISFLCNRLFEQLDEKETITLDLVEENSGDSIESFCRQQLIGLPENELVELAKDLISENGRRKFISLTLFNKKIPNGRKLFDDDTKLLHTINIPSIKETQVEIIHDRFATIIKDIVNDIIEKKQAEILLKKALEEKDAIQLEKNIEYNRRKRLCEQNVLTRMGRRLINNALDFGDNSTYQVNDYPMDTLAINFIKPFDDLLVNMTNDVEMNSTESQTIFHDEKLSNSNVEYDITFSEGKDRISTLDGIYGVKVQFNHKLIEIINFFGKNNHDGIVDYETPFYIRGGFCSIFQKYDINGRVIEKEYRDETGEPCVTSDGYSCVKIEYDKDVIKYRYYKKVNGIDVKCKHRDGNFGFDSYLDKAGNEIERFFVGEDGQRTSIVTGVYGKRMEYWMDTFLVKTISNLNEKGELAPDNDGYVTVHYWYDKEKRETKELYFNKNGDLWYTKDVVCGQRIVYSGQTIKTYWLSDKADDSFVNNKDGYCSIEAEFNSNYVVISTKTFDVDGNSVPMEKDGKLCNIMYSRDSRGLIDKMMCYDKTNIFIVGFLFDFDKCGNHVIRYWHLNSLGRLQKDNNYGADVYGFEYDLNMQQGIPILCRFVNNHNQWTLCENGYYAYREWNDSQGRTIKRMYYNTDGIPMKNNDGVFGVLTEYVDENTIVESYLNEEEEFVEDIHGVCRSKTEKVGDDSYCYLFDKENKRTTGNHGYWGLGVEKSEKNGCTITKTFSFDIEKNPVESTPIIFELHDNDGREILSWKTNSDGDIIPLNDEAGFYLESNYSSDGLIKTTRFLGKNKEICRSDYQVETYDELGRSVELVCYDCEGNLTEMEDGLFGIMKEYYDGGKKTVTKCIGSDKSILNYNEITKDDKERVIEVAEFDSEHKMKKHIEYEYVDNERQVQAFYCRLEEEAGIKYSYNELDALGRPLIIISMNKERKPVCDKDGDYGVIYEYDDEKHEVTESFLDANLKVHNNVKGFARIKHTKEGANEYIKIDDRDIKRLFLDIDDNLAVLDELEGKCCGNTYQYLSNGAKIVGYIGKSGAVCKNENGYAYKEIVEEGDSNVNGVWTEYYYDEYGGNVLNIADGLGDYGKRFQRDNDSLKKTGLDKFGIAHQNNQGYYTEIVGKDESGRDIFRTFLNRQGKPIANDAGDYGWGYVYFSDNSGYDRINLNKNGKEHNNELGVSKVRVIKDVAGDEWSFFYSKRKKQVLPCRSLRGYYKYLNRIIKQKIDVFFMDINNKDIPPMVARQMGAQYSIVMVRQEKNGSAKRCGLTGNYVLIQFEDWHIFEDPDNLVKVISNFKGSTKQLSLLPIEISERNHIKIGEIIKITLPKGKMGLRLIGWDVNQATCDMVKSSIRE